MNFEEIKLVSLSTTLATNAIVERKTCNVGLVLVGKEPNGELPIDNHIFFKGRYSIKGELLEPLDTKMVNAELNVQEHLI